MRHRGPPRDLRAGVLYTSRGTTAPHPQATQGLTGWMHQPRPHRLRASCMHPRHLPQHKVSRLFLRSLGTNAPKAGCGAARGSTELSRGPALQVGEMNEGLPLPGRSPWWTIRAEGEAWQRRRGLLGGRRAHGRQLGVEPGLQGVTSCCWSFLCFVSSSIMIVTSLTPGQTCAERPT